MSKRLRGLKHQPPWAWFAYNRTFKHYQMGGYASEQGCRRFVNAMNKCMGGVWEAHTCDQLVGDKYPVEGISRDFLLYEVGVRVDPVRYPPTPQYVVDHMFPMRRAVFPVLEIGYVYAPHIPELPEGT